MLTGGQMDLLRGLEETLYVKRSNFTRGMKTVDQWKLDGKTKQNWDINHKMGGQV